MAQQPTGRARGESGVEGVVADRTWRVMKFGGTSVASAQCFRDAASIVRKEMRAREGGRMAVVVSAMGGKPKVTDLLLQTVNMAIGGFGGMGAPGGGYEQRLLELRARHVDCLRALLPEALWAPLEA